MENRKFLAQISFSVYLAGFVVLINGLAECFGETETMSAWGWKLFMGGLLLLTAFLIAPLFRRLAKWLLGNS